jgi:hypothetical protein
MEIALGDSASDVFGDVQAYPLLVVVFQPLFREGAQRDKALFMRTKNTLINESHLGLLKGAQVVSRDGMRSFQTNSL